MTEENNPARRQTVVNTGGSFVVGETAKPKKKDSKPVKPETTEDQDNANES